MTYPESNSGYVIEFLFKPKDAGVNGSWNEGRAVFPDADLAKAFVEVEAPKLDLRCIRVIARQPIVNAL